jgi:hypothetical protein
MTACDDDDDLSDGEMTVTVGEVTIAGPATGTYVVDEGVPNLSVVVGSADGQRTFDMLLEAPDTSFVLAKPATYTNPIATFGLTDTTTSYVSDTAIVNVTEFSNQRFSATFSGSFESGLQVTNGEVISVRY